ncbi:MAG: GNAT family N-acetyltransferase [Lachnospiraceae bacterium]|nr:GNAT family N-acetyltransferase [Lachnospiraceae bacterium]
MMKEKQGLKTVLFYVNDKWRKAAEKLAETLIQSQVRVSFLKQKEAGQLVHYVLEQSDSKGAFQHILVVTDSEKLARELTHSRTACVGCAEQSSGYFEGAGMVTDAPDALSAEELEEYLFHYHGWPVTAAVTERLILREIAIEDAEGLYRISIQDGMRYLQDTMEKNFFRKENLLSYIKQIYQLQGYGLWSVRKKDGTLIGCCGLANTAAKDGGMHLELQYMLDEKFQHYGYGLEMCRAAIKYAFARTSWDEIWLRIHPENQASLRLAEKLGFRCEKTETSGMLCFRKSLDCFLAAGVAQDAGNL